MSSFASDGFPSNEGEGERAIAFFFPGQAIARPSYRVRARAKAVAYARAHVRTRKSCRVRDGFAID
jgi:hypothetical protein